MKALKEHGEYKKLQMETLQSALNVSTKGAWFTRGDLRDASAHLGKMQKILWILPERQTILLSSVIPVPPTFTKLTKPVLAHLHNEGHSVTSFIDDSLLIGQIQNDVVNEHHWDSQDLRQTGFHRSWRDIAVGAYTGDHTLGVCDKLKKIWLSSSHKKYAESAASVRRSPETNKVKTDQWPHAVG